jgi:cytochrome c
MEDAMLRDTSVLYRPLLAALLLGFAGAAHGVDVDAAKATAKANGCYKCHSADKEKDGPSFKATAAKYKGKPDAQATLVTHLTTGPGGHPVIKAKDDAETKNLVDYILSQ